MAILSIEILGDVILEMRLYTQKLDGYSQSLAMYRYGKHHAELMITFGGIGDRFIQIDTDEPITKEQSNELLDRVQISRDLLAQKTAYEAFAYITSIVREIFEAKEETSTEFMNANDIKDYFETEEFEDKYEIAWEPANQALQYFVDRRRKIVSSHRDAIDVLDMKNLKWLNLRIRRNKHSFYRSITFYNNHIYVFSNDIILDIEMRPIALEEESFNEVQKMIAEELIKKLTRIDVDPKEYVRKI